MTRIPNLAEASLLPAMLVQLFGDAKPALGPQGHLSGRYPQTRSESGSYRRYPQVLASYPVTTVRCVFSGQAPPEAVAI